MRWVTEFVDLGFVECRIQLLNREVLMQCIYI